MINVEELRLGNWVLHKGIPTTLSDISKRGLRPPYMSTMCGLYDFKPIPLTSAIIKEIKNLKNFTESEDCTIFVLDNNIIVTHWVDYNIFKISVNDNFFKNIEYVHQLQNIFYYLSYDELKIGL